METGYFGGIHKHRNNARQTERPSPVVDDRGAWHAGNFFVRTAGPSCRLYSWDSLALVVRGTVRLGSRRSQSELDRVAAEIRAHYLEQGTLPISGLEGSFTLIQHLLRPIGVRIEGVGRINEGHRSLSNRYRILRLNVIAVGWQRWQRVWARDETLSGDFVKNRIVCFYHLNGHIALPSICLPNEHVYLSTIFHM